MKYIRHILIPFIILLYSCDRPSSADITILYTSDVYGFIFPYDLLTDSTSNNCLASFATLVDEQRAINGDYMLVLDNGNKCVGSAVNTYFNFIDTISEPIYFKAERMIGYDATGVGVRDLEVKETINPTRHDEKTCPPRVCANIINKHTGKPHFAPYFIKEINGIKVAVLPMTSPNIVGIPQEERENIYIEDMVECAQKWVKTIREKENPDVLVGMFCCNSNYKKDNINIDSNKNPNGGIPAAIKVAGFDLVLLGDAEEDEDNICTINNYNGDNITVIQLAQGCNTAGQARIHLDKDPKTNRYTKRVFATIVELDSYEPKAEISENCKAEFDSVYKWFNKPIGYLVDDLYGDKSMYGPDYYRNLIHNIQLYYTKADVSMSSALLAGDTIKAGPMSMKRIYCLYPYENQLYTVKMTGQDIINFLEWGFSNQYETMTHENAPMLKLKRDTKGHIIYREDGRPYLNANPNIYTCAAGISYTVDLTKPEFQRVRIDSFCDGRRFCPKQTYVVALNSYQIGDGGYYISKGLKWDNATLEQHTIPTQNNNIRLYIGKYFQMKKKVGLEFRRDWMPSPEKWFRTARHREEKELHPVWNGNNAPEQD